MVQSSQIVKKELKKGRAQYDKVGKYRYLLQKMDRVDHRLDGIEAFMRYLAKGLQHSLVFEPEYIQDIACQDEVDQEILEELRGAGEAGLLPRDIARRLGKDFNRFFVLKRLKRMNKRLDAVLDQRIAEKRGKNWALTSFMRGAWDSTREEILESEGSVDHS